MLFDNFEKLIFRNSPFCAGHSDSLFDNSALFIDNIDPMNRDELICQNAPWNIKTGIAQRHGRCHPVVFQSDSHNCSIYTAIKTCYIHNLASYSHTSNIATIEAATMPTAHKISFVISLISPVISNPFARRADSTAIVCFIALQSDISIPSFSTS